MELVSAFWVCSLLLQSDTTQGELSALNGVAGALCERVKMIHVVGQTTR
jgi:hypothetical protein